VQLDEDGGRIKIMAHAFVVEETYIMMMPRQVILKLIPRVVSGHQVIAD